MFLAHSALRASVYTVRSNLELIEDAALVAEMGIRSGEIEALAQEAFEQVKTNVEDTF